MKRLTKLDRDEIEFQIACCTRMDAKIYMNTPTQFDLIVSDSYDEFVSLQYMVKLSLNDDCVQFEEMSAIHGKNDEESMMEMTMDIDHALRNFNYMWVK